MKNDIEAKNWVNLQELLFEKCYTPEIKRFRSPFVFRGLFDSSYKLSTSLIRLEGNSQKMEKHLLRNFKKYAQKDLVSVDSDWNWLSVAQHHGLPTRLLDWTFSPYVALHFATVEISKSNIDGAIWCVDFIKAKELLPEILKEALNKEEANGFSVDILNKVCPTLEEFDKLKQTEQDFIVFFEPPSIDERIVNQFALFSVISNPSKRFDEWLDNYPELYYRIIIPSNLKWEIRDKLDQANITERVLFPGLDGLSAWLKRWYTSQNI